MINQEAFYPSLVLFWDLSVDYNHSSSCHIDSKTLIVKVMGYLHDCRHATPTPCIYFAILLYWYERIAVTENFVAKNKVMGLNVDQVKGLKINCKTVKRS